MNTELKAVLAECNRIRKTLGLPPRRKVRKGVREDDMYCPVAATIGCGTMDTVNGSLVLRQLATAFDAGGYPELEVK